MTRIGLSWVISAGSVIWSEGHNSLSSVEPLKCPQCVFSLNVPVPLPAALLGAGYEEIEAKADIA